MKRSLSTEDLVESLAKVVDGNDILLGPTQRQQVTGAPDLMRRGSVAYLLSLLAVWWALSLAACVAAFGVPADSASLSRLIIDVALFERHPLSANDGAAAVVATGFAVGLLFLSDVSICRWACPNAGARWFLLHSIGNFFVVVLAAPDFVYAFRDPPLALSRDHCAALARGGYFAPCSDWPTCMIIALHAYHCLAFNLDAQDVFHHLLFVPIIAGSHFVWPWGTSSNILAFFISGLPGAIDYALLAAVKSGKCTPLFEKRINCSINTWIRSPGISGFVVLATCAWMSPLKEHERGDRPPGWLFVPMMMLVYFNGQFYAQRVIGNYYVRKTHALGKRGVKHVELHNS
eukprot:g7407.t1